MWSVFWVFGRCFLAAVVFWCCLLYFFTVLGEGASQDFGHKCEPFLCVNVYCRDDCLCACAGNDLYVRVSGGLSFKDTSCANSARGRVWKLYVLLITIGMIWTWNRFFLLYLIMTCLSGSYMLCMLLMVSKVLQSVKYLHSMSCMHLLPMYVVSSTSRP